MSPPYNLPHHALTLLHSPAEPSHLGWYPDLLTFTINTKLTLNYRLHTQLSTQVDTKLLLVKMAAAPLLRTFRPRKDALDLYTDLVMRYRLDCAGIELVTDMVRRDLQDPLEALYPNPDPSRGLDWQEFGIQCSEVFPEDF